MRLINETSNRMSDIIDLIDAIAFQTNILAPNAAVGSGPGGRARSWLCGGEGEVPAQQKSVFKMPVRSSELIESSTSQTQDGDELGREGERALSMHGGQRGRDGCDPA